jgi:hypothetical protein
MNENTRAPRARNPAWLFDLLEDYIAELLGYISLFLMPIWLLVVWFAKSIYQLSDWLISQVFDHPRICLIFLLITYFIFGPIAWLVTIAAFAMFVFVFAILDSIVTHWR